MCSVKESTVRFQRFFVSWPVGNQDGRIPVAACHQVVFETTEEEGRRKTVEQEQSFSQESSKILKR